VYAVLNVTELRCAEVGVVGLEESEKVDNGSDGDLDVVGLL